MKLRRTPRLLVVQKVVYLQHAQHNRLRRPFHCFMEEEVGELLVRQGSHECVVFLIAALRAGRREDWRQRRIYRSRHRSALSTIPCSFASRSTIDGGLSRRERKQFNAGADFFRLKRIAKGEARLKPQVQSRPLQVDAVNFLEKALKIRNTRLFHSLRLRPMRPDACRPPPGTTPDPQAGSRMISLRC